MPRLDLFRTTAFRWAMTFAAAFTVLSVTLFAFVYWQTAHYERAQLDDMLRHEAKVIADDPGDAVAALKAWLRDDLHSVRYGLLAAHDGVAQAGNMPSLPKDLWPDGKPQYATTEAQDADGDERGERIRAIGLKLPDGRTLALGNDTDALEHVSVVIIRALGLGLGPMPLGCRTSPNGGTSHSPGLPYSRALSLWFAAPSSTVRFACLVIIISRSASAPLSSWPSLQPMSRARRSG